MNWGIAIVAIILLSVLVAVTWYFSTHYEIKHSASLKVLSKFESIEYMTTMIVTSDGGCIPIITPYTNYMFVLEGLQYPVNVGYTNYCNYKEGDSYLYTWSEWVGK